MIPTSAPLFILLLLAVVGTWNSPSGSICSAAPLPVLSSLATVAVADKSAGSNVPQQFEAVINKSGIKASFLFLPLESSPLGALVTVNVESGLSRKFAALPDVGFEYHVHEFPVGPNGDCKATGGHLDPTHVGMAKRCQPLNPELCQEGDLSGKHGNLIPTESGALPEISYIDHQLQFSTTPPASTFTVGRSLVIHNNGERVACADILPVADSPSPEEISMDISI